jgi:hypothetical protein
MAAFTPFIHGFLGHRLFLLSSGILLTWPYHCSLFLSVMSMMSGFPFTPISSFICSFIYIFYNISLSSS